MKKELIFASIVSLTAGLVGCAGTTDVVSTGPDSYMVASHGTMGWSSGPAQKASAFEKASAYCGRSGKEMEVIQSGDSGTGGFGRISSAEVDFRCVPRSQ
ncbi:hypothetical protein [Burkholderia metallica]|uniref:hypothetical protein n=1 Tax=Burkholderia metallica TaxID=488729 RepID=UPI001CF5FDCB|nr:hypothetical protein [Burkholderia metallica]MCA8018101.1 hypothetical protein [Burkholderia metallica]